MRLLMTVLMILSALSAAYAHGGRPGHIDEGPDPGTMITIVMIVSWIVIALGVVFFVLRLIRKGNRGETGKQE